MADKKISQLPAATTPLVGTEVLPIVQSSTTDQVSVANLTAGRAVSAASLTLTTSPLAIASGGTNQTSYTSPASSIAGLVWFDGTSFQNDTTTSHVGYNASTNVFYANTPTFAGNTTLSTGNLVIGTSGKGIDFSATPQPAGMTSELLADYEEGTWTPALTFNTPGDLSVAYTTQIGTYTKVGNIVTVSFNVVTSTFTWTTAASFLKMTGLPYTVGANDQGVGIGTYAGITRANYTQVGTRALAAQTYLIFNHAGSGQTTQNIVAGTAVSSGTNVVLFGQITYTV